MRAEPNISLLFSELPLLERPRAAAAAGFAAAEMWWPFAVPDPSASEVDRLARAFEDASLRLALLNFDGGDIGAGDRGVASNPNLRSRFRANVDVAVALAGRLGCQVLHALYGNVLDDVRPEAQRDVAVENLTLASIAAASVGARVVVEALNLVDNPRYGLRGRADAIGLIDELARTSGAEVRYLFDTYHEQRSGEDPLEMVTLHVDRIGHVQVADSPGRHEPGTGMINFGAILDALSARGYDGWIGLEFVPSVDTQTALLSLRRSALGPLMGDETHGSNPSGSGG